MKKFFEKNNVDALWINNYANRRYFTGFTGSAGIAIALKDGTVKLFVDSRYTIQAKEEVHSHVLLGVLDMLEIKNFCIENNVKVVAVDGAVTTINQNDQIEKLGVKSKNCSFDFIRIIKSEAEITKIKQAVNVADEVFSHIIDYIKIGMSEIEISEEMLRFGKTLGATGFSFDAIVATGPNSAIPHHRPTDRLVQKNEFIKLDFGFKVNGYCSDMTRTIQIGKADKELVKAYKVVLKAQEKVIKKGCAGMACGEIQDIAMKVLARYGLDTKMGHSLGHGIGLEVHESPFFGAHKEYKVQPGVVFTNEPGVYFPGLGGIRIEDIILVTDNGFKVLNSSPKELITIKG